MFINGIDIVTYATYSLLLGFIYSQKWIEIKISAKDMSEQSRKQYYY